LPYFAYRLPAMMIYRWTCLLEKWTETESSRIFISSSFWPYVQARCRIPKWAAWPAIRPLGNLLTCSGAMTRQCQAIEIGPGHDTLWPCFDVASHVIRPCYQPDLWSMARGEYEKHAHNQMAEINQPIEPYSHLPWRPQQLQLQLLAKVSRWCRCRCRWLLQEPNARLMTTDVMDTISRHFSPESHKNV